MSQGVLAQGPDVSGLCMLACYPRAEEAEALAREGGSDPEKMHVTVVFLGEVAELDMQALQRVAAAVARKFPPLAGIIGGVGMFAAGDDGYPLIALPSVKRLSALRTRSEDALANVGIKSPSEFGWVPHLTLAYADDPELADTDALGKPLSFDALTLTVADERIDFPFVGPAAAAAPMSRFEQRRLEVLLREARAL